MVAVLVVGSAVLAGCGGDGDDAAQSSATEPTSATTAPTVTGGGQIDERCVEAAAAMAAAAQSVPQAFSGAAGELESSVAAFEAFADSAPSEIREDLKVVAEGYAAFVKALAESGFDPTSGQPPSQETMAALSAASESLEESEFEEAANRVTGWFETNCPT